ncbi:restriction endonuclease subunit S [Coprococcus aceti]|jgi:type I restriction enzyme S subunit|uniref:Restriction endonuclease subunit S n=1 Tax=Coprococcus aceti TaxID=2981786 RepID=A0ABV1IAJ2_9FIRM
MGDNSKKPGIRFKGFTDDWEQRKLGELGSLKNGMNFSKKAMGIGFPFVNLQNIFGNNVIDVSNLGKAMASDSQLKDYNLLNGDVLFVRSSVKLEGVGEAALVPQTLDNTTYSGFIIRFRDEYGLDNNFKRFVFGIESVRNQIMSQATNSANKNISQSVLENLELAIPSKSEQQKIGAYFSNLDHLITLHQRKYDKLVMSKKSMLEKMFPKNGQTKPEIRFSGFIDDWEQRKLGDVAEFSKGSGYSKGDLVEYGTPIILYGRLYTNYETRISDVDTFVEAKVGSVYSKGGEVIVPASGETAEDIARAATVDKSGILLGGDLNIVMPNKDINSSFLAISISSGNPQRELAKKAQGKSVVHIHNEEIKNLVLPFPIKDEQNKIASYFCQLDNLITLHQRELEKLKKIKLSMLEKMFV